jgi:hypothetical protein
MAEPTPSAPSTSDEKTESRETRLREVLDDIDVWLPVVDWLCGCERDAVYASSLPRPYNMSNLLAVRWFIDLLAGRCVELRKELDMPERNGPTPVKYYNKEHDAHFWAHDVSDKLLEKFPFLKTETGPQRIAVFDASPDDAPCVPPDWTYMICSQTKPLAEKVANLDDLLRWHLVELYRMTLKYHVEGRPGPTKDKEPVAKPASNQDAAQRPATVPEEEDHEANETTDPPPA